MRWINIKRFALLVALVLIVISIPATLYAQDAETGFFTKLVKFNGIYNPSTVNDSELLDLETLGNWQVWYTGSATVSAGTAGASLVGNYSGNIWNYEYSADNTNNELEVTNWKSIGSLVETIHASAKATGDSGTINGGPVDVYARWLRISYNATLMSDANAGASASGSGSIAASAVPEPGTILAACAILSPVGFVFRRRMK